ncbi:30S ribosomal protein S2 [Candidatus Parcubacteria bacterium]|nr:30S ribosomal protein S2 [Candidatus Parcubacteria bacterium]
MAEEKEDKIKEEKPKKSVKEKEIKQTPEKESVSNAAPKTSVKSKKSAFGIKIEDMEKTGVNFGHRVSRLHPKMKPYLAGVKNTTHIIDLEKTSEGLEKALEYIQKIISEHKILLFVGTKIQVKDLVKETAEECGLPYVCERWLGGAFTNFSVIKKRIDYLIELEDAKKKGGWEKYTKKERIKINKEFEGLKTKFGGLKTLVGLPEAIFIADIRKDDLAVKEAKMKGVKVVAICDTNVDPSPIDYPIPGNDDAILSVKYILDKVKETILKSK